MDIEKDIERPEIVGYAGPRLKIAGNFESETERKVIREFNAYEAEIVPKDLDCTPDNGQIVKQWYLRQPPFRIQSEICSPGLNAASFGCTHLQ